METPDEPRIDIRKLVRAQESRRIQVARLAAPADWASRLQADLQADLHHPQPLLRTEDLRLFVYSFSAFFIAIMTFLA